MSHYQQAKHQIWIDRISTPANTGMDLYTFRKAYAFGYTKPNYPVPAISYRDMLIDWNGEHRLCVVYGGRKGFSTLVSGIYIK